MLESGGFVVGDRRGCGGGDVDVTIDAELMRKPE